MIHMEAILRRKYRRSIVATSTDGHYIEKSLLRKALVFQCLFQLFRRLLDRLTGQSLRAPVHAHSLLTLGILENFDSV
jgi:hypothetical protein